MRIRACCAALTAIVASWSLLSMGAEQASGKGEAENPQFCYVTAGDGAFRLNGKQGYAQYCFGEPGESVLIAKMLVDMSVREFGGKSYWRYKEEGIDWYWYFPQEAQGGQYTVLFWTPQTGILKWADAERCEHAYERAIDLRREALADVTRPQPQDQGEPSGSPPRLGYDATGNPHRGSFKLDGDTGQAMYCEHGVCFHNPLQYQGTDTVAGSDAWIYIEDFQVPYEFAFLNQRDPHGHHSIYFRTLPGSGPWVKWTDQSHQCKIVTEQQMDELRQAWAANK